MKTSDFTIHSTDKLDVLLSDCVSLLLKKRSEDPEYWGMVSAAIHDPDNNIVFGVNHLTPDGTRKHAERVAMENYTKRYGKIPSGCIIVTTLSPCSDDMPERWHESCTELLNNSPIKKVYAGYSDPSQGESQAYKHKQFHLQITKNKKLNQLCRMIGQQAIK
jgi:pyrimidine deaminase RibD-like protein